MQETCFKLEEHSKIEQFSKLTLQFYSLTTTKAFSTCAGNTGKSICAYKTKHADNLFQIIRVCRIRSIFKIDAEILKP